MLILREFWSELNAVIYKPFAFFRMLWAYKLVTGVVTYLTEVYVIQLHTTDAIRAKLRKPSEKLNLTGWPCSRLVPLRISADLHQRVLQVNGKSGSSPVFP